MSGCSGEKRASAIARSSEDEVISQLDAIMARINAISEDPLRRSEAEQLRRAYTAAVVSYFDHRRMAER